MRARVLVPEAEAAGQTLALPPDEAVHVGRVLRLRAGDPLRIFDGRGREWEAQIVATRGAGVTALLGTAAAPAPECLVRYTLAAAVLKGDATDELIRDAVMMGAASVRPFVATRSETRLPTLARGHRHDRWMRVAVASAKQCGRAVVPAIEPVLDVRELLDTVDEPLRILLVEPGVEAGVASLGTLARPSAVTLAVGPEGGWTGEEIDQARAAGWTLVRLGHRTLRAASMAVAALSACQAIWDEP